MTSLRRSILVSLVLLLSTLCFRSPANGQNVIALVGSGSNLPTPLYNHWTEEFNKLNPQMHVRNKITRTEKENKNIKNGVGDFAA